MRWQGFFVPRFRSEKEEGQPTTVHIADLFPHSQCVSLHAWRFCDDNFRRHVAKWKITLVFPQKVVCFRRKAHNFSAFVLHFFAALPHPLPKTPILAPFRVQWPGEKVTFRHNSPSFSANRERKTPSRVNFTPFNLEDQRRSPTFAA